MPSLPFHLNYNTFPEAVIGDPLERRLPTFLKDMFGPGEYRVDLRKTNGHFERSFPMSIADTEPERQQIIDIEPDEIDDDSADDYSVSENHGQMTAVEVENLLLKERLKRIEEDQSRRQSGSQSDTNTLINALEESRREQRELMLMMLSQSQKPQQDATLQAMTMLEKSFGMITKARQLSDEIAPATISGDDSFLGNAARVIDSVGKAAPAFMPMLTSLMGGGSTAARSAMASRPAPVERIYENTSPIPATEIKAGELSDLAGKIKNKDGKK